MPGPPTNQRARWTVVLSSAALSAVVATSCAPAGTPPTFPVAQAKASLTVQVADQLNDVGRAPSVAIGPQKQPIVSYLLYQQAPKPGVLPAPIIAGAPQPPAVMVAMRASGTWARQSVTPQKTAPARGDAREIATKKLQALSGVSTSLAVDPQGKDHVIWSTPSGLFYSDNTGGSFSAPEQVSKSPTVGGAIAVGADGSVWVSYYQGLAVKAASRSGTAWKVENVASISGAPGTVAVRTAIGVGANGPVVAYGDGGTTVVATRSGGVWTTANVTGQGGYGVSLALGKDGTPVVAYYDGTGNVIVASGSAGSLSPTTLARSAPGPNRPSGSWSTGVGVDDQGNQYVVFADTAKHQIDLAVSSSSGFRVEPIQDSHLGATPTLAVDPQGTVLAVAWYDTENQNLDVAVTSAGGLILAFSPNPASPVVGGSPSAATCTPSGGTTLSITAPNGASASGFDTKCLAVKAGSAFTLDFKNEDVTIHNWELYKSQAAATSPSGRLGGASGPTDLVAAGSSATYKVNALPAGTYYFQCDVHPTVMNGTFVVSK